MKLEPSPAEMLAQIRQELKVMADRMESLEQSHLALLNKRVGQNTELIKLVIRYVVVGFCGIAICLVIISPDIHNKGELITVIAGIGTGAIGLQEKVSK